MTAQVIRGDARLLPLADESADLIVTSPPYWALRSYTDGGEHYDGQIGAEPTPAAYIDSLIECTREWMRVLKPTGSMWINLGDKYAGSGGLNPGVGLRRDEHMAQGARGGHRRSRPSSVDGVPGKSLIGLPWRYAIRCIDDLGLILRAEVIWSKPNGLPESVTDRVRRSHEQWFWLSRWAPEAPPPAELVRAVLEQVAAGTLTVDEGERLLDGSMTTHETAFHLVKSPRYFSAVDTIREAHSPVSVARAGRAYNAGDHFSVGSPNTLNPAQFVNPLGKLPGSVWTIPTQPFKVPAGLGVDHFAAFPMEWPRRIIQGWSPSGICTACGEGRRPVASVQREAGWTRQTDGTRGGARNVGEIIGQQVTNRSLHTIVGEACACPDTSAPTRPSVVLDPFGGTGTTALVAHAYGRHGISVDMSADYCRLAGWRTTDPGQLAAARERPKPPPEPTGIGTLFDAFAEKGPAT